MKMREDQRSVDSVSIRLVLILRTMPIQEESYNLDQLNMIEADGKTRTDVLTLVEGFVFDVRDAIRVKLGVEEAARRRVWLAIVGADWPNVSLALDEGIGYEIEETTVAARLNDKGKDRVRNRKHLMTAV